MKNTLKRILLLGLVLAIGLHCGVVLAQETPSKVSGEFKAYLATANDTDTMEIVLFVTGAIPSLSQEEYERRVIEIMGEENYRLALTGSPQYSQQVNQLLDLTKQFQKEAEETFWDEILIELSLEKTDDMVMAGVSVTYTTTKAEVLRLASLERVETILWLKETPGGPENPDVVTDTDVTPTDIGNGVTKYAGESGWVYQYTAESALHILKACVGKEAWHYGHVYDVNANGTVSAEDALWALQSAVGKRIVVWAFDHDFLE